MRFWFMELPALVLTVLYRVWLTVFAAVITLCIATVLIQLGALILGLPIPFLGQPPH